MASHLVEELSWASGSGSPWHTASQRASVLLADEPTSELDASTCRVVIALRKAQARAEAVVLMAPHDTWCANRVDAQHPVREGGLTQMR